MQNWTQNQFIYKPSLGARGAAEKTTFDAGLDRIDTRLGKEIWLGDPLYGSSLADAISAIGATFTGLRIQAGTHAIAGDLTVPANVALRLENGAVLSVADGVTLTINGPFEVPENQVFSLAGTGNIKFNNGLAIVRPEWWGIDGAADEVQINAAIQAAPVGGIVKLLPKTYILADKIILNRPILLCGTSIIGSASTPDGTKIDASAVTGTAIEVTKGSLATCARHQLSNFWLYCGPEIGTSKVTKGIDIQENCSQWRLFRVMVTGVTQAQDGSGSYYGLYVGGNGDFSGTIEQCYFMSNDIGVYLGTSTQHTTLIHSSMAGNYTNGCVLYDTNTISFVACQLEKNGKIADTTASLQIQASSAVTLLGCYGEQNSDWPGAAIIVTEKPGLGGVSRNIFIDAGCRFLGNNSSTKGIILKRVENFYNFGRLLNFTDKPISYEPIANVDGIVSACNYNEYFNACKADEYSQAYENGLLNPYFEEWHNATDSVYWTNAARGVYSRDTDAGKLGNYNVKMIGDGVTGEVSITQTLQKPACSLASQPGGVSVLIYVKCPVANAVTSYISVGGRQLAIAKSDSWQWLRTSIVPSSFTTINVSVKLCNSASTAQATDILLVGYVGIYPGYAVPAVLGGFNSNLRASYTWNVGILNNGNKMTSPQITVTGASFGDKVEIGAPVSLEGVVAFGYVDAADKVRIRLENNTGSNIDFGNAEWRIVVRK